jgi:hydrogenase maturation factor
VSRLHRVVAVPVGGRVDVADIDGGVHRVSLLALDGPVPRPGEWLIVHSGYAINRVESADAEAVVAEMRAAGHHAPGSSA